MMRNFRYLRKFVEPNIITQFFAPPDNTIQVPKVIMTTFAGRRKNLEVLLRYTDVLYARGQIQEYQLWDFTIDPTDATWIREINRPYVKVFPVRRFSDKKGNKIAAGHWTQYYRHFTKDAYPDHIIIKCDDDIVFIDIDEFPNYVQRRIQEKDHLLAFPSIVNNGVCAYHQQQLGLIPETLDIFPYDTLCGKLVDSGSLAQKLHLYFIENWEEWLTKTKQLEKVIHPLGDRFSINFFAVPTAHLENTYGLTSHQDEQYLSANIPKKVGITNYIDMRMTVAHLAFGSAAGGQRRGGSLDEGLVISKYHELADKYLKDK